MIDNKKQGGANDDNDNDNEKQVITNDEVKETNDNDHELLDFMAKYIKADPSRYKYIMDCFNAEDDYTYENCDVLFESFENMFKMKPQLLKFLKNDNNFNNVETNDKIIKICTNTVYKNDNNKGWVIAGSSALSSLVSKLVKLGYEINAKEFKADDTDVFFLDSKKEGRAKFGDIDVVHKKFKTVSELLLNFDLPCCRAATDNKGNYWVSLQCLSSIFTGKYAMPVSLESNTKFNEQLKSTYSKNKYESIPTFFKFGAFIAKLHGRMEKYKNRGFTSTFVEDTSDEIQLWIKNQIKSKSTMYKKVSRRDVIRIDEDEVDTPK